ncbi:MAG: RHS repeat domain-containing protein [Caldilineaceae bacterium]
MGDFTARTDSSTLFQVNYTYDALARISTRRDGLRHRSHLRLGDLRQCRPPDPSAPGRSTRRQLHLRRQRQSPEPHHTVGHRQRHLRQIRDRLTKYGDTTYAAYTANGELKSKTNGSNTTTYTYDGLGNLTAVGLPSGDTLTHSSTA